MTNSDLEHTILIFQLFFFSILFCMCAVELPILISNIYPDFEHPTLIFLEHTILIVNTLSWFTTSTYPTFEHPFYFIINF